MDLGYQSLYLLLVRFQLQSTRLEGVVGLFQLQVRNHRLFELEMPFDLCFQPDRFIQSGLMVRLGYRKAQGSCQAIHFVLQGCLLVLCGLELRLRNRVLEQLVETVDFVGFRLCIVEGSIMVRLCNHSLQLFFQSGQLRFKEFHFVFTLLQARFAHQVLHEAIQPVDLAIEFGLQSRYFRLESVDLVLSSNLLRLRHHFAHHFRKSLNLCLNWHLSVNGSIQLRLRHRALQLLLQASDLALQLLSLVQRVVQLCLRHHRLHELPDPVELKLALIYLVLRRIEPSLVDGRIEGSLETVSVGLSGNGFIFGSIQLRFRDHAQNLTLQPIHVRRKPLGIIRRFVEVRFRDHVIHEHLLSIQLS